MTDHDASITRLLGRWQSGDRAAEEELARAIYPLLRQVAISQDRKPDQGMPLSATDLYIRIVRDRELRRSSFILNDWSAVKAVERHVRRLSYWV
ncbi:hypothetical protein C7S18_08885 [Ahniella affigens]|uniref:Uncharacterized protein n=1 Tax=Ahniella affigens TaxID=2021234 RepID=A0A2P1PR20_9GAMM|nr:hypothetical protein [Ahniella affigens]AVP97299.1 hypothetical protein C7S18_08885 [Ahniella affigens]